MAFQTSSHLNRNTQTNESKLPKGYLRCFQCREASLLKEGAWRDHQNMQVFMCKACKLAPVKKGRK